MSNNTNNERQENLPEEDLPASDILADELADELVDEIGDLNNIANNERQENVPGEEVPAVNMLAVENDELAHGQEVVEDIGHDCQIIYVRGQNTFKPFDAGYKVKINDELSGNIPFKENVSLLFKNTIVNMNIANLFCIFNDSIIRTGHI